MTFVIEDGYNTTYMVVLFMVLFYDKSMIERYLLIDNNSNKFTGLYLQKLILHNFVKQIRNDMCITSKMLNEIRLCAITVGWKNFDNIFETYDDFDPIDFLCFILKLINFVPIEIEANCNKANVWNMHQKVTNSNNDYNKFIINTVAKSNMQETYDYWACKNKIINIPIFIIFKLDKIKATLKINKKIFLFTKNHQYHNIKWIFHGLFYKDNQNYKTILNKDFKLVTFEQNNFPNVEQFHEKTLPKIENKLVYIIYRKEPTI